MICKRTSLEILIIQVCEKYVIEWQLVSNSCTGYCRKAIYGNICLHSYGRRKVSVLCVYSLFVVVFCSIIK